VNNKIGSGLSLSLAIIKNIKPSFEGRGVLELESADLLLGGPSSQLFEGKSKPRQGSGFKGEEEARVETVCKSE